MATDGKAFNKAFGRCLMPRGSRGFTLVEILVTLAIFTIILGGFFSAYLSQLKHTTRETKSAEAEIELGIAKGVLLRDLELAGYGLADDYSAVTSSTFAPLAAKGNDGGTDNADDLFLTGTALSLKNRAAQEWTYMSDAVPNFRSWGDVREDVAVDDRVVLMEPSTKTLLTEGGKWLFQYNGSGAAPTTVPAGVAFANPAAGTLVYALYGAPSGGAAEAAAPYWTVRYYLGGARPDSCAAGTSNLERNESDDPNDAAMNPNPLLTCVLDMEVAFGLDTNEDGNIDTWDDGGKTAAGYTEAMLRKQLKTVKVYLLVQSGSRDRDYTFPAASLRVGEGTTIGRTVPLSAEQRHFRWRMVTITKTLRNLR